MAVNLERYSGMVNPPYEKIDIAVKSGESADPSNYSCKLIFSDILKMSE